MPTLLALSLLACGLGPQQKDSGSDSDSNGGTSPDGVTIHDIRSGDYVDGDSVTVEGVIVTSPLTRKLDGFFVQDPEGGEKSGIYVWMQAGFTDAPAQVGDVVTISGTISEYYDWTELVISDAASVTITSTGTVPDPVNLGDGAGVDWDAYESVLVTLEDQTVESVDEFNTGMLTAGVNLDDGFQYNDYDWGGHFDTVTGVVFYQYEEWSVNNRSDDDLGAYTAPEPTTTTVMDIQQGLAGGPVALEGVVVTSEVWGDAGEGNFFVQDVGGGAYSGILVFASNFTPDVHVGDVLNLGGEVSEYYGLTEFYMNDEAALEVTGTDEPTVDVVTEAPADWEEWESCLISLQDVEVTVVGDYGQSTTNYGIYIDDLFTDYSAEVGTTWSSVTGPLYYTSFDDIPEWKVEPRSAADFVE